MRSAGERADPISNELRETVGHWQWLAGGDACNTSLESARDFEGEERVAARLFPDPPDDWACKGGAEPLAQDALNRPESQRAEPKSPHPGFDEGALETDRYQSERAGEIVGLYTITRFKGEGVGVRLIDRVMKDAGELGLAYVFACTTEERAQTFFERHKFERVTHDDVPAAKWTDYDPERKARLRVFRRPVEHP